MRKKILAIIVFTIASLNLYCFDEGFIWGLRVNLGGSMTLPSISKADLNKLGAAYMKGSIGLTVDGEAELGYLFGTERWFGGESGVFHKFSGISLYGSLGVGNGFAGEVAGNTVAGVTANMYINVNYAPVISFGIGSKVYLLESRLALGLQLGGKIIADTSPEYLAYSDQDLSSIPGAGSLPEMGEIIVTDFMMKNMNPLMFTIKLMLEYNQPISERLEVILGIYSRFNIYKPKYITMPKSLLTLLQAVSPDFTPETPLPSFYLNSVEFGLSLGLQFKG